MSGFQEGKLGTVIDRFYEAAAQPELWRTVLHETSIALGATGTELFPGPRAPIVPVYCDSLDEVVSAGISQGWFADNPRVAKAMPALKSATVITESMIFSPEELDRLPFNADFVGRFGFRWFAALYLVPDGEASVFLSIERQKDQGIFSHREIDLILSMVPHLRRAGQMALRLGESRAQGMLDAFDQMSCGGVLINVVGRAIRLNSRAQRHIGRGLTLAYGQLTASHRDANAALQRLIGSVLQLGPACEASARGAVAIPRLKGRPLIVHAAPIVGSARDIFQSAKAVLMIVDPDDNRDPAEPILRQAFGLTPAEARLAVGLAQGRDLAELSGSFGIGIGTARAQLKAIFVKTGTHRQGELVALLGRFSVCWV
jgi:DNA-binding CsgD family transcriptional regulator